MGMTIVEKILARAGGVPNVSPGDFVVVNVDTAVLFDNNFSTLYWRDAVVLRSGLGEEIALIARECGRA